MTLPNALTFLRILLTFVIAGLVLAPAPAAHVAAFALFVIAALTDWLDGLIARRAQQVSSVGMVLDPIADKILVLALLFVFAQRGIVPAWAVIVIAIRETLVTGMRLSALHARIVIPAAQEGKHKAVAQMAVIVLILADLALEPWLDAPMWLSVHRAVALVIPWSLYLAVALTVFSGARFLWANRSVFLRPRLRRGSGDARRRDGHGPSR